MSQAAFEHESDVVRPRRWLAALLVALPALWLTAMTYFTGDLANAGSTAQFLVMGLSFAHRAMRDNWKGSRARASVRVDDKGLWTDGALAVAKSTVADAVWMPARGGAGVVRLLDKRRNVLADVQVDDENEALAALGALGIDPSQRRARFAAASPVLASYTRAALALAPAVLLLLYGIVHVLSGDFTLPSWALPSFIGLCYLPFLAAFALPTVVEVGADGVLVSSAFGRRFVALADVIAAAFDKDTVTLALRDEGKMEIKLGGQWAQDTGALAAEGQRLLARLNTALAAHRSKAEAAPLAARLARGERDGATWVRELRELRDGASTYRSGEVREDDLWRVVDDPAAPADARAAAAFLLRKSDTPDSVRGRLRVASDAIASPKLRVALETVAAADDVEAIEAALTAMSPEA